MDINLYLFQLLNAPEDASLFMRYFAVFIAHDLIYVFIFIFVLAWLFSRNDGKENIIKGLIFTIICLSLAGMISWIFQTPRPFVTGVGQTILEHAPTASFPSNHMAIFSGLAFSYYFSSQRPLGLLFFAVAWLVAWARIYVGVHYPIDMLGSFILAFIVNLIGLPIWMKYKDLVMLNVLRIHRKIFSFLIHRGYIP